MYKHTSGVGSVPHGALREGPSNSAFHVLCIARNHLLTCLSYLCLQWLSSWAWWGQFYKLCSWRHTCKLTAVCNRTETHLVSLSCISHIPSSSQSNGVEGTVSLQQWFDNKSSRLTIHKDNEAPSGEARRRLFIFQVPLDWTNIKNTQRQ